VWRVGYKRTCLCKDSGCQWETTRTTQRHRLSGCVSAWLKKLNAVLASFLRQRALENRNNERVENAEAKGLRDEAELCPHKEGRGRGMIIRGTNVFVYVLCNNSNRIALTRCLIDLIPPHPLLDASLRHNP
jgi:hypothetical protein